MKSYKYFSLSLPFLLVIFLTQCRNPENQDINSVKALSARVYDGDYSNLDISKEFIVKPIKLETRKECIIGQIVNVEVSNKFLYVLDQNTLYLFTISGQYIKKINRGKGPGEVTRALNISYDEEYNELYLIERGNVLHVYDENINYKETYVLNGSYCDALRIDSTSFLLYSALPAKWGDNLVVKYDVQKGEKLVQYIPTKEVFTPNFQLLCYNNFVKSNEKLYVFGSNSHYIYQYLNNEIVPTIHIDFNYWVIPKKILNDFENQNDYMNYAKQNNKISFTNSLHIINNFKLLGISSFERNYGLVVGESSEILLIKLNELLDLPDTESFKRPINSCNNKLIFAYYNDVLITGDTICRSTNFILHGVSININIDDNPSLIILDFN
ncbi:MAG: 6-bladed beta-propeller [Bacteroidales bacterium]|jgi:hypothetical protein